MPSSKARKQRRLLDRINETAEEPDMSWDNKDKAQARLYGYLRSERRKVYAKRPHWEGDRYRGHISSVSRRAGR